MSQAPGTILKLNTSARVAGSQGRPLVDELAEALAGPETRILTRDVGTKPPAIIDEAWVAANFTPTEDRTDAQRAVLAQSDELVGELKAADAIIIGAPIYNFSVPAALKAWIDQVARARETFRYTANGPEGLLTGKKAYLVVTSGGVPVDSAVDFATGYLRHVLGFLGITDITVIAADTLMSETETKLERARQNVREAAAA